MSIIYPPGIVNSLQPGPSEASGCLLLLLSPKGTLRTVNQNVICSLSQESGHTEPHAPAQAYHVTPPQLIRKPPCPREAKMEFFA